MCCCRPRSPGGLLRAGRRRIVLTTDALRCLDDAELEAVLAHERAHLRQGHHLVLAFAAAIRDTFPFPLLFTVAAGELSRLVGDGRR